MADAKVKVGVVKQTGEGENIAAEVLVEGVTTEAELKALLRPVLNVMDDRLLELNTRVSAANARTRQLKPDVQMLVHEVFELLHGRKSLPEVAKAIEKQSEEDKPFASDREAAQ